MRVLCLVTRKVEYSEKQVVSIKDQCNLQFQEMKKESLDLLSQMVYSVAANNADSRLMLKDKILQSQQLQDINQSSTQQQLKIQHNWIKNLELMTNKLEVKGY